MERAIFDIIDSMNGLFAQGGLLMIGMVLSGAGAVVLFRWLSWQRRGTAVDGRITGLRRYGDLFYPVYSYDSPDGRGTFEAMADEGRRSTLGMETGTVERIIVTRDAPESAHPVGKGLAPLVGIALLGPGLVCFYFAFTSYPVNGITWAIMIAFALYSLGQLRRLFGTRKERRMIAAVQQAKWTNMAGTRPAAVERVQSDPETRERQDRIRQMRGMGAMLMIVAGIAGVCAAIYIGAAPVMQRLQGQSATGHVSELAGEYSKGSGNFLYYPVVQFTDAKGQSRSFRDAQGDNPAAYDEGDSVTVVYRADDPAGSAQIDRGKDTLVPPALLGGLGLLLLLGGFSFFPAQRDEVR